MEDKEKCGIVMPISALDGCSEHHWTDVQSILSDAIVKAGFEPNLVSQSEDIGIIQKRIVENLYYNPVVVCDVSGKNANVMFELGLRLAFDKATIIVKDDKTTYSFDTSPIEHLEYPRDLRYSSIVDFKEKLSSKISATYTSSKKDKNYSTFLKHFGEFKVAKLEQKEVPAQEIILDELRQIRAELRNNAPKPRYVGGSISRKGSDFTSCMMDVERGKILTLQKQLIDIEGVADVYLEERSKDHVHLHVTSAEGSNFDHGEVRKLCDQVRGISRPSFIRNNNKPMYREKT